MLSPEFRAMRAEWEADAEAVASRPALAADAPRYFTELDLGQAQDHSALAIVERTTRPDPEREGKTVYHFDVRYLRRWPLGTAYPAVVAEVKGLFAQPPLKGSELAIDQTGVGRAVFDLMRGAGISAHLRPLTITGGEGQSAGSVAKKNLVGAIQIPLQAWRLEVAPALPLAAALGKELEAFRVKVTASRNEVFESWRERDHDDLIIALALALYVGSFPPATIAWL